MGMTQAILASFLATFLWAITNFIDNFLVNKDRNSSKSIRALLVFSTLVAGIIFVPISLVLANFNVGVSLISAVAAIGAAAVYIMATALYFYALNKNDTSSVVAMYQLIPVVTYLFSFIFYGETFTVRQTIGAVMIIVASVVMGLSLKNRKKDGKYKAMILVLFSVVLYGLYYSLMDIAIRDSAYDACYFWNQIGFLILGLILICIKNYRKAFISTIKRNGKSFFALNILNEGLNSAAGALVNFANVMMPIAFVNIIGGFQGAFVFIIGAIGMKIFPKFFKENLKKKTVVKKIFCIILSIIGIILFML